MNKIFLYFIVTIFTIPGFSFAQDSVNVETKVKTKVEPKVSIPSVPRNHWSMNFVYTDNGFGLCANLYKKVNSEMDLVGGVMFAGVKDKNEVEIYDIFGNSYVNGKINRVYIMPVTLGIQNYLFSNTLDETLRPFVSIGISPTLVLSNPYDKDFFKALGYFNAAFAFGGYAGIGMEYRESGNVSFSANIRYSYLPVIVNRVQSLQNKDIKDVGGLQLMIGVVFQK